MLRTTVAVCLLSLLLFAARVFIPIEFTENGPGETKAIWLLRGWARHVLNWSPAVGLALLIVLAAVRIYRQKQFLHVILVSFAITAVGIGLFVVSWAVFLIGNLGPWEVCHTITGPDGEFYSFLDSSFLQGQTMAITRRAPGSWLYTRHIVLGTTNGDSPRFYASIIRPDDSVVDGYGKLYVSKGDWILGMRSLHKCYMAYHISENTFYCRKAIIDFSPYFMLDANARPHPMDVAALTESLQEGQPVPTLAVIREGLTHANPEVRQIAESLEKLAVWP